MADLINSGNFWSIATVDKMLTETKFSGYSYVSSQEVQHQQMQTWLSHQYDEERIETDNILKIAIAT